MSILKNFLNNLQTHVIAVFSLLLFLSFAAVGLAFNLTVNRYVTTSAASALAEARAKDLALPYISSQGWVMRTLGGDGRILISEVNTFIWHDDTSYSPHREAIVSALRTTLPMGADYPMADGRLRVDGHVFFVLLCDYDVLTVYYLDATNSLHFMAVVNRLLLLLVTLTWVFSMIIAVFLADSMVRPLRLLRDSVKKIGSGDFSPTDLHFRNEEFEELNQSLNQTARQLAGYDNDQKIFFQNVSHELRTPLMAIKSYAEGIKHGVMPINRSADTILDATDRLTEMVNDILYISRMDSLTPPIMENENLCAIAKERVKYQSQVAKNRGIIINFVHDDEPIMIQCAKRSIDRAVDNLISNAIRYAKQDITIECYAIGSRAILRVTDDGEGFDKEALPYVFERFYKGKNGLAGIGLSMVKSIIDQHKGIATAENGNEKGAVLTISLPRVK
ncbi:MAG: HAMP domain-containing histidine kinase [Defluviitaleaceae bacterium]|nr:HAMP domain-containing histidine kinase [Defluviitaleaceae bacterium]